MRARTLVLAVLLASGLACLAGAQDGTGGTDGEADPFAFTLDVKEKVLENGLRVLVAPRKGAPRVACAVWFRVGSVDELPGRTGLAHCLEHMMFKGTHRIGVRDPVLGDKISAQLDALWSRKRALVRELGEARVPGLRARERALAAALQRFAAAGSDVAAASSEASFIAASSFGPQDRPFLELRSVEADFQHLILEERKNDRKEELWDTYVRAGGTNLNAFTTEDTTNYVVTLPSNKLELFFWLEADRLTDPVFREWYPEREVVKEERRNDENAADGPFYEALNAVVYGPHPYGHPVLGWTKDLDDLMPRDAMDFFEEHYSPENATCVLVGDVDPEQAFSMAARYLGKVPKRKIRVTHLPVEPTCPGEKRLVCYAETEPRVEIWWKGPESASRERDVLDVIAEILGGDTGRLYKALVEEGELAISVEASLDSRRYAGRFHVAAHAKPETDLAKLEEALDAEVAALSSSVVTPEELARAKNRLAADAIKGLEDLEGVAESLGRGSAVDGDWRAALARSKRIRDVTADEVKEVAAKTFKTVGRTVGVLARGASPVEEAPAPPDEPVGPSHPHPPKPGHRR